MELIGFRILRLTRQFDAMLAFYRDTLEMRCIQSWERPGTMGALLTASKAFGQTTIEILQSEGRIVQKGRPANIDLALEVKDVDAWHDRFRRGGVNIVEALEDKPWGHRAFSIEDPDGLRITLYQTIA
jgi:uncharacterized glyoxalase superfamily protein PhnB